MSSNQHLSFKDRITSKLPGHRNQDNNANGIPDRLEKNTATGLTGQQGLQSGLLGQGLQSGLTGQQYSGQNILGQSGYSGQQFQPGFSNDLNRNGIPDQYEGGQNFSTTSYSTSAAVVDVREAPTIVEKLEKAPVIHEVIRTEEVVEVQPIIEREREKLDVYEVVQPIREREVVATEVRTAVLPQQTRATVVADQSAFLAQRSAPAEISTRDVAPTLHQTVQNAPIVHETITHKVIEEVQPVIYKEIDRPVLIKETLPIYEKIVEAPQAHFTTLPVRDLGTRTTMLTDFNRNGIPDQYETGMGFQGQQGYQQSGLLSQPQIIQGQGLQSGLLGQGLQSGLSGQQFSGQGLQSGLLGQGLQSGLTGQQSGLLGQQGLQSGLLGQGLQSGLTGQQFSGQQSGLLGQQGLQSGFSGQQPGIIASGLQSELSGQGLQSGLQKGISNDLSGLAQGNSLGNTAMNSRTY